MFDIVPRWIVVLDRGEVIVRCEVIVKVNLAAHGVRVVALRSERTAEQAPSRFPLALRRARP